MIHCPRGDEEIGEGHGVGKGGDGSGELGGNFGAVVAGPGCEAFGCGRLAILELLEPFGLADAVV